VRGPLEALAADASEVDYLLAETNRILPGVRLDEDAVIATFAGARPLLAFSGSSTQASREHRIELDRRGLVSIMGGKFTTYRRMAEEVVDGLVRRHLKPADRCLTDQVSLLDSLSPLTLSPWEEMIRAMDPDLVARLLTRYGAGAFHVLKLLAREPALAHPICPHHEYLEAELAHALEQEFACTITDLLARRTRIAWSACQGLDALSTVTALCERFGGLPRDALDRQAEAYRRFLAQGLAFRRRSAASQPVTS
jgi:glycerol-3-phosphate dehydrogenase